MRCHPTQSPQEDQHNNTKSHYIYMQNTSKHMKTMQNKATKKQNIAAWHRAGWPFHSAMQIATCGAPAPPAPAPLGATWASNVWMEMFVGHWFLYCFCILLFCWCLFKTAFGFLVLLQKSRAACLACHHHKTQNLCESPTIEGEHQSSESHHSQMPQRNHKDEIKMPRGFPQWNKKSTTNLDLLVVSLESDGSLKCTLRLPMNHKTICAALQVPAQSTITFHTGTSNF